MLWYPLLFGVVYVATVLESGLGPALDIGHVSPDLLSLTACVWLLCNSGPRAYVAAGLVGLVSDLNAPGRLGVGLAAYTLVGYALVRLQSKLRIEQFALRVALTALAATIIALCTAALGRLLGDHQLAWSQLSARALLAGVYTSALSLPLFLTVGWFRESRQAPAA